jgi:methylphosphotriester-DNA--protein-cysteine methyltransferase
MQTIQCPPEGELFISAITQKVHRSATCSMTRRNLAQNLATTATAAELAEAGYVGCKRCTADLILGACHA